MQIVANPKTTTIEQQLPPSQAGIATYAFTSASTTTTIQFPEYVVLDGATIAEISLAFPSLSAMTLTIPSFAISMQYDPDFSVLLNSPDQSAGCDGDGSSPTDLLPLLALIVVPALFLLLATIGLLVVGIKKRRTRRSISARLGTLNLALGPEEEKVVIAWERIHFYCQLITLGWCSKKR